MQTLRVGSTGPDVVTWQKIVGVKPDGIFGTGTAGATRTWQRARKLAPDGEVGPKTWALATGAAPPSIAPNAAQSTDQWAYDVAKTAAPAMPEAERQYALSVARGEGFYGKGWGGSLGAGSNNWGAVQGTGDAGAFQHVDHHADGSPYTTNFKKYSTPQAGFLDMAQILLRPNVQAALKAGNLHDAVYAQHSNGYFELAPQKYLSAVEQNYSQLTANLSWKKMLAAAGVAVSVGGFALFVLGSAAAAAWWWLRGRA